MNDAQGRKYGNADGYDNYMGGWSAALSPMFLDFVGLNGSTPRVLDLGCGTGNLLAAVAAACPGGILCGIDPSPALLDKARQRRELGQAELQEGVVERLPFDDGVIDFTLSMLVLQEFSDRSSALREMRRVTRPGGLIAGCQWDFERMPVIAALVEAIEAVSPEAGRGIAANSPRVFHDEAELRSSWRQAGLRDVRTTRLRVERIFPSFNELWAPLLAGSTPSTLALASLSDADKEAVRESMHLRLAGATSTNSVTVRADALAVVGTVPPSA